VLDKKEDENGNPQMGTLEARWTTRDYSLIPEIGGFYVFLKI